MSRMNFRSALMVAVLLVGFALPLGVSAEEAGSGAQDAVKVKLETSLGEMVLELYPAKAPESVKNFLAYVDEGFYDGTIFHRIVPGFVIQGGGYDANMLEKPTKAPIRNEAGNGLANNRYTVAMARTSDPHSATSQFYINLVNNQALNYKSATSDGFGYAVFGKVVSGQEVADKIAAVQTRQSIPVEPVVIVKAERVK